MYTNFHTFWWIRHCPLPHVIRICRIINTVAYSMDISQTGLCSTFNHEIICLQFYIIALLIIDLIFIYENACICLSCVSRKDGYFYFCDTYKMDWSPGWNDSKDNKNFSLLFLNIFDSNRLLCQLLFVLWQVIRTTILNTATLFDFLLNPIILRWNEQFTVSLFL